MNTYFVVIGSGAFLVGGYALLRAGYGIATAPTMYFRLKSLLWATEALYPLGMGFKLTLVGPDFVRFHLADLGFPAILAMILFVPMYRGYIRRGPLAGETEEEKTLEVLTLRKFAIGMAVILSYAYEIFVGVIYAHTKMAVTQVGNFDWIDIVAYTLSGTVVYVVLVKMERELRPIVADIQRRRAEEAQAALRAQRKLRKADRKGRRRGQR